MPCSRGKLYEKWALTSARQETEPCAAVRGERHGAKPLSPQLFEPSRGGRVDVRIDLLPAWEPDRTMSNKAVKRAVSAAAGPIAVHIDNMLSDLPAWASHEEIASELVAELGIWSRHPEFVRFLTEALAARRSIRCLGSCSTRVTQTNQPNTLAPRS